MYFYHRCLKHILNLRSWQKVSTLTLMNHSRYLRINPDQTSISLKTNYTGGGELRGPLIGQLFKFLISQIMVEAFEHKVPKFELVLVLYYFE